MKGAGEITEIHKQAVYFSGIKREAEVSLVGAYFLSNWTYSVLHQYPDDRA